MLSFVRKRDYYLLIKVSWFSICPVNVNLSGNNDMMLSEISPSMGQVPMCFGSTDIYTRFISSLSHPREVVKTGVYASSVTGFDVSSSPDNMYIIESDFVKTSSLIIFC